MGQLIFPRGPFTIIVFFLQPSSNMSGIQFNNALSNTSFRKKCSQLILVFLAKYVRQVELIVPKIYCFGAVLMLANLGSLPQCSPPKVWQKANCSTRDES